MEKMVHELKGVKLDKKRNDSHIPSSIQADTLFTFVSDLEFLIPYIEKARIYPRYSDEELKFLKIKGINTVYIPMKCFCDINLHRISDHLDWYGFYGLAFPKEWGMKNGIQPVHYINPDSEYCKEYSKVFNKSLKAKGILSSSLEKTLKNHLLHELMYLKPYEGNMKNRRTQKTEKKCFTDECEWRYIPDLSNTDYKPIYYDTRIINAGIMNDISNSLTKVDDVAIKFDYSELKHIIVQTSDDLKSLVKVIDKLDISYDVRNELISKIIIWDKSKGDF